MDNGSRTPLGELLVAYRLHRGFSQNELAARTAELAFHDDTVVPISSRTIMRLEGTAEPSTSRRGPRHLTVHSLAIALGLRAGSPTYDAFLEAARQPSGTPHIAILSVAEPAHDVIEAGLEQPLRDLARAFDDAARGEASAILVRGELGTGKSTLVAHACNLALERHPDAVVLWGRAGDDDQPHGPFRRIIRQMLGDPDPASAEYQLAPSNRDAVNDRTGLAARALVDEAPLLTAVTLSSSDDWGPALARLPDRSVAESLASLASTEPDDSLRAVSGCEQFYRLIARYAAEGLVILVFDDLQRMDTATLSSLEHLLSRIQPRRNLKLAIVGTCLPGRQLDDDADELTHLIGSFQRIFPNGTVDLDATTVGEAADLFAAEALERAELPADPATVDALVTRTAGNPLFIAEVVDTLREQDATSADITSNIESAIPQRIADDLNALVRRLPDDLQGILKDASVLGPDFRAENLMRMRDLSPDQFIERVDRQLWRRHGLLRADGTAMIGGHMTHTYRFDPPLLRDAIYNGLSNLERTLAHGRAAEAIRDLYGETEHELLDRLAHHLERSGNRDEAARAYLRAGNLARTQRDFLRARELFGRIDHLGTRVNDPETWIRTQIALGLCARAVADYETARMHLRRALDLARSWHDETVLAAALEALGMLDFDAGDMAEGRDRILRAVDIWSAHDAPETSRALANLSYLLYGLGRYDDAISSAERARVEATRTRQPAAWIDGTIGLANCWIDLGHYDRAAELYEHAALVGSELGDGHRQRICWVNLTLIAIERGDWGAAELALDHVVNDGEPISGAMAGVIAFHSGLIAEGRGNAAAALAHYRQCRELRDRNEQEALAIDAVAGELRIALASGEGKQVEDLLAELERRLDAREDDGIDGVEHPGRLYTTLIEASLSLDRHDRARHHARGAIAFLTARGTHVSDTDRESYLWGVTTHRRILELAERLGVIAG